MYKLALGALISLLFLSTPAVEAKTGNAHSLSAKKHHASAGARVGKSVV